MSASSSKPEDGVKVEKGPEGELKKTISTTSSSAETATPKDDEKSTFRGPDSGSSKLFNVEELKKLKVTLEIKKRKPTASTSSATIDPSSITPVRRPDQVSVKKAASNAVAEDGGLSSEGIVNITEGQNEVIEDLKIPFPTKRKYISENNQFYRASKRHRRNERDKREYDALGFAMSRKLLRMDSTQAIYAESLINEILKMGLFEELSSSTKIHRS